MLLLALALIVAQEGLPPVPPAQPSPSRDEITALACTFESALRGEKCVYEAVAVQVDPRDNTGRAIDAGKAECALQAAGDADLRKDCEAGVGEASRSTACASAALTDASGHLAPAAADCVAALGAVLRRTFTAAAWSLDCCKCLAESRCSIGPAQCKREVGELKPQAALLSCLRKSTCAACNHVMPAREPPPSEKPVREPSDPEKI